MRLREIKRAAWSLAILIGLFALYTLIVVPFVEPPAPRRLKNGIRIGATIPSATQRYQTDIAGLFPVDAWENRSPKILRNRNTLLLFQDYQPQDDGTLRVFPCTAIVIGDDSSDEARRATSLILQAPAGAVLQMKRSDGVRSGQLGTPVAGFLSGKIHIHSAGHADGSDRLDVVTSDVQIKRDMIMTPHEVELQFENSHATGRDLMIKLLPLKRDGKIDKTKGWAGLNSIELVQLDRLHLEIDNSPDEATTIHENAEPESTPVDVVCSGPLRVDFVNNVVTLDEQVELRRSAPEGVVDTLQCHRLLLYLHQDRGDLNDRSPRSAPSTVETPGRSTPERDGLTSLPKLQVAKVVAEGNPVVLDAPSRRAHVRSKQLLYDLQRGRFHLRSTPDQPSDQVYLRYDQQEMVARQLDCRLDEAGELTRVHAPGPGRFVGRLTGSEPQPVEASWAADLLFEKEGDLHRLSLTQDARVDVGDRYGIDANLIHLWLEPAPRPLASAAPSDEGNRLNLSLRPHRLVAVADPERPSAAPVHLRALGVVSTTQKLNAQFRHVADSRPPANEVPRDVMVTSADPRPRLSPIDRRTDHAFEQTAPTRETRIAGRDLKVWLRSTGRDVTLDNLVLRDDVRVQQYEIQAPSRPLFDLRADAIRMRDPESNRAHSLTAVGNPVEIDSDQMRLQTNELNLDQAQNLIWTRQPGRMWVRVDRNADGQRLPTPQEMTLDWSKTMDFDGLTARFKGNVEVKGTDQRLRGESLSVRLNNKVVFGNSSPTDTLDIEQVRAEGNVLIENREFDQQTLTSISYLQVPFARINRKTGDLVAGGPGRVMAVRRGFRGNLDLARSPSTRPASQAETDTKTFLQVDYQREITGNITRKIVRFSDRVQVIYGPVHSWNETLDDNAPLRQNDVLLSCDELTVAQNSATTQGPTMLDLVAQGNTYVEGQTFTARGDRVSYDQSKELLVLQGTGNTDAFLSHQTRVGASRSETAARKILYWTRTGRVEFHDTHNLNLSNLTQ